MIYLSNVSQTQHIGHRISEIKHVILFQNYLPIRTPSTGSRAVTTVSTTTISTKTTSSTAAVSSVCRWNTGYICSFGINLKRGKNTHASVYSLWRRSVQIHDHCNTSTLIYFKPSVPLLYPLKTSENQRLRGIEMVY